MDQPVSKANGKSGDALVLTSPNLFEIEYVAPPEGTSDLITTCYHFRCDEKQINDIQPAAIGHFAIFPYGQGEMRFRNGQVDPSHEVNLLTPFSVAAPFVVDGPFHAIGAVLSPLGWAALTGLHAGEHGNRLYGVRDFLGGGAEAFGKSLCEQYRAGERSGPDCALAIGRWVGEHARSLNPRHAELIAATNRWLGSALNPPLDALYDALAYSPRQAQRLVERYFGLPPQALARKYRALRAAGLLSLPQLAPEYEAQLGEAFYDQSHMIREIQLFAGRTPKRLSTDDSPYLSEMLDLRNFREIDPLGEGKKPKPADERLG